MYIVQLYPVGVMETQLQEERLVPMNESTVVFSGLDTPSNYEVSVGTRSLSGDASGPGAATHYFVHALWRGGGWSRSYTFKTGCFCV